MEITLKEIANIVSDKNIDYIASVCTPWHVNSLKATINRLEIEDGRQLKGVVLINSHATSGYLVDESYLDNLECDVYYFKHNINIKQKIKLQTEVFLTFCFLKKSKNTNRIYVLSPNRPAYDILTKIIKDNRRSAISILIDEGIGIYVTSKKEWAKVHIRENKAISTKIMLWISIRILDGIYMYKLRKNNMVKEYFLMKKDIHNKYITNEKMVISYRNTIEKSIKNYDKINIIYKKYIIYSTQLFSEKWRLYEIEILKKIKEICEKYNIELIIKPHPRDKQHIYEDNGFNIINEKNMSQEIYLYRLDRKPLFILGYNSTTLITGKVINNVETIGIGELLFKNKVIDEKTIARYRQFESKFDGIINYVHNYEEFEKILVDRAI